MILKADIKRCQRFRCENPARYELELTDYRTGMGGKCVVCETHFHGLAEDVADAISVRRPDGIVDDD